MLERTGKGMGIEAAQHLKKSPKNQRPNKALYFPKGNQIVKMHYYDYLGL